MGKKFAEYSKFDLSEVNKEVLKKWDENQVFAKSMTEREGCPSFVFFEGPPSANGMPGIHHVMARSIKDIFCRYKTMKGFQVKRKAGWDTHGLPVELGVEKALGITKEDIRKALSDFQGVEHRLEKVARVRGIDFINDSKATNVNSCWYALQSMTTKTVLILGGKDKGNDYTEIEELVRTKCSALVYLGLHNEKLHEFFDRFGLPVADVQTGMKDAVEAAFQLAKKGETVLLSPCCASFDLFKSYEDRGDQFKKYVREL